MKKKLLLTSFCLISAFFAAQAQNKTLGVGVTAPNSNAALHVESPTSNQGFIMPRLTSAQRTAMSALLTAADGGLMLYDTTNKTIYIWDGAKWKTTGEVAGGAKLGYPYKDSVTTATGTSDLFALKYNNAEPKRLLRIENLNSANGSSALSVSQQGSGFGGFFSVNNPTSGGTAISGTTNSNLGGVLAPVGVYGESTGTGSLAAAFRINNATNNYTAVYAETNGTGNALRLNNINASNPAPTLEIVTAVPNGTALFTSGKVQAAAFQGDGSLLTNLPAVTFPFKVSQADTALFTVINTASGPATRSISTGTSYASIAQVANGSNQKSALYATTNGTPGAISYESAAIFAETSTAFSAITARVPSGQSNAISALSASSDPGSYALLAQNSGMGPAVEVNITNAANTSNALGINNSGTGPGLNLVHSGTSGTGAFINTTGATTGVTVFASQQGTGRAGQFQITNPSNNSAALRAYTDGLNNSGFFTIANASNSSHGVFSTTNGTGAGVFGQNTGTGNGFGGLFTTAGTGTALQGENQGSANGFAGYFVNTVATNTYPAIQATTTGSGPGLRVYQGAATTGGGVDVNIQEATNSSNGYSLYHAGTGNGLWVTLTNTAPFKRGVYVDHQGASGEAGKFENTNSANSSPALDATSAGTGPAFVANHTGTGSAAAISIANAGNSNAALYVATNGTGPAIVGVSSSTSDTFFGQKSSSSGTAGNFQITNASNTNPALVGLTNAVNGSALGLTNSADGVALQIFQGGMRVAVVNVNSTTITTRASAYDIQSGGTTFSFQGGLTVSGDVFLVSNSTGSGITVAGVAFAIGEAKTLVNFNGTIKGL
jgi:hypothetical protein